MDKMGWGCKSLFISFRKTLLLRKDKAKMAEKCVENRFFVHIYDLIVLIDAIFDKSYCDLSTFCFLILDVLKNWILSEMFLLWCSIKTVTSQTKIQMRNYSSLFFTIRLRADFSYWFLLFTLRSLDIFLICEVQIN